MIFNHSLAQSIGINSKILETEEGIDILAGNEIPPGGEPLAQAYAGHQFGHFTLLGDGRAILLGEQLTKEGKRVDIQLKGSGRTPYSRGGDGRAALGPMLREYIMSEAMHALGIPTTRSLAVVTTGEPVFREKQLKGAILTRIASSHIRVGTFQFAAVWGTKEDLKSLADYTINRHYPHIDQNDPDRYLTFFKEVIHHQAQLIAKWQLVGFIHGVMNTDNMTISGETIDYGPCAFMDTYHPETVFSSIDHYGRYAYGNQPPIGAWNLARFAEALLPLFHDEQEEAIKLAEDALNEYRKIFELYWINGMRAKLGIFNEEEDDKKLITQLLDMMKSSESDYTNTFLALTFDEKNLSNIYETEEFPQWKKQWQGRLSRQRESLNEVKERMKQHNPAAIPRNHRVEEALEAAENGDLSVMKKLLKILEKPYSHTLEQKEYRSVPEANVPYRTFCGT